MFNDLSIILSNQSYIIKTKLLYHSSFMVSSCALVASSLIKKKKKKEPRLHLIPTKAPQGPNQYFNLKALIITSNLLL